MLLSDFLTDRRRERLAYRALFEKSADAAILADAERRIVRVNAAFVRLFGYDAPDVLGRKTAVLYDDREAYEAAGAARYNPASINGPLRYRTGYRTADGSTFEGLTTGIPVRLGSVTLGYVGTISAPERR